MSKPTRKSVHILAEHHRAIQRARLEMEERGEAPPSTQEMVEKAILDWLKEHCPEALETPGRGRPRKTPRKD